MSSIAFKLHILHELFSQFANLQMTLKIQKKVLVSEADFSQVCAEAKGDPSPCLGLGSNGAMLGQCAARI